MTLAFDHVHVVCDNVETVGSFLRDVIGARELRRNAAINNWEMVLGDVRIFVRQRRPDESLADASVRRAGVDHIGLAVADIVAEVERLTATGCSLVQAIARPRSDLATAFLMAPGGLLLELLQRGDQRP